MTLEFLRNSDLGAKPFDLLATSPAKAPLHADSLAFYADDTHKMTPKPALTVASRWE